MKEPVPVTDVCLRATIKLGDRDAQYSSARATSVRQRDCHTAAEGWREIV
ncbi:hypothetical protein E2C01_052300 [Portunus trituberculatus]|uniref:Uncharacterized protein n=1 Tax=Portunus trituberculatus TaxID=210409 RepID=A0A5B7GP12_PORTR|nr:hypothetical protein [Portunus trituberculatus]